MPALISSRLLSFCGMREKLGNRRCPLLSKKERYISRSSFTPYFFFGSLMVSFVPFFSGGKQKAPVPQWDGGSVVPPKLPGARPDRFRPLTRAGRRRLFRGEAPGRLSGASGGATSQHSRCAPAAVALSERLQRRFFPIKAFDLISIGEKRMLVKSFSAVHRRTDSSA